MARGVVDILLSLKGGFAGWPRAARVLLIWAVWNMARDGRPGRKKRRRAASIGSSRKSEVGPHDSSDSNVEPRHFVTL